MEKRLISVRKAMRDEEAAEFFQIVLAVVDKILEETDTIKQARELIGYKEIKYLKPKNVLIKKKDVKQEPLEKLWANKYDKRWDMKTKQSISEVKIWEME